MIAEAKSLVRCELYETAGDTSLGSGVRMKFSTGIVMNNVVCTGIIFLIYYLCFSIWILCFLYFETRAIFARGRVGQSCHELLIGFQHVEIHCISFSFFFL